MYYSDVFFFKQKTAYELRISDWSSDVCASDLMPAWPLGKTYTRGLLDNDQKEIVAKRVSAAANARAGWTGRIATMSYDQIRADPDLMAYVREDGHRLFGDNCAACHGMNAAGNPGFPNLVDGDWLWGGSADAIAHTIAVGINRSEEHTSELQSLMRTSYAVFCLKKNNKSTTIHRITTTSRQNLIK